MPPLSEAERKWVDDFLGKSGVRGANGGAPDLIKAQAVVMAGPNDTKGGTTGGTTGTTGPQAGGPGGTTGGTGPGAPSGGGGTSGTGGKAAVFEVQPERVVKMGKLNTPVLASVNPTAHADAWRMHGMPAPAPIAYMVDKNIHVDMSRWPANLEKPTITPHASGGPKINPPPGKTVKPMQFPNNPNHTLQGTTADPGGGAGKGPGGSVAVPDDKIAATHKKSPKKTTYTFSTSAHTDIWAHAGNKPPAPIAFMQDGHMRVDVERWSNVNGKLSTERLAAIGLEKTDWYKVGYRGEAGAQKPGSTEYPGHREPPPGVYDKQKAKPNADMTNGADRAQDAIKKGHTDPQGVWKSNISPELKKRLDDFADPKSPVGKSVKNVNLEGKSAVELHKELINKGFKHHWEPLAAGTDKWGHKLYKMRDGSKTADPKHPNVIPHDIYTHPDGGMVRVKPEGDPGDKFRPEPHASKSVVLDTSKGSAFDNEGFKVTNEGDAVPKNTSADNGMKKAPSSGKTNADINRGFQDATMSKAHTSLPKVSQAVPSPTSPGSGGPGTPDAKLGQIDKSAKAFINSAQENLKEAKNPKSSTQKVQTQTVTLEKDAESIAKQLRDDPKMKGISGNAKQFFAGVKAQFSTVRGGAAGLVLIAMNVSDAMEMVSAVRDILDSKSIEEALKKSMQLGKAVAKGAITFTALRFVTRSTPGAVFITVFIGDLDKNSEKDARRLFAESVMAVVNKVRPGAVERLGWMGTNDKFLDKDAEKLYHDALKQAYQTLTDQIANEVKNIGIADALAGSKTKKKVEVSDSQKKLLPEINDAWLAKMYQQGVAEGDRQRVDAVKRVEQAGYKDGSEGKPADFEAIKKWPELQALIRRYEQEKTTLTNDEIHKGQTIYNNYENTYNQAYEKGRNAAKAVVLTNLEIAPKGFTMGAHTTRNLTATGTFSNKTTKVMSGDVTWRSSDEAVVRVWSQPGDPVASASMLKPGRADVFASYDGVHGAKEAKISIVVNPPMIDIMPKDPKLKVGATERFRAYASDPANEGFNPDGLDSSVIYWDSDDQARVAIDSNGNVTVRAAGPPVKISATYRNSPVQVRTTITITS